MCQPQTITFEDSLTRTLAAADTLRACGAAITSASLEAELKRTIVAATATDYAPPDPCTEPLKQLRAAATAAPEQTFEDRWKADRLRAMNATRAVLDANPVSIPRLTAAERAELAAYAPPDGYGLALKALKEAR